MGLAEKRAVKAFEDGSFAGLREKIVAVLGFEPEIEVKWSTMAMDGQAHLLEKTLGPIYFEPVVKAFESLCADDMGKEAIQEVLKKIVFQNEKNNYSAGSWASFADGQLTLEHDPISNAGEVDNRANNLQKVVEKAL